jgi:hypothetical protein
VVLLSSLSKTLVYNRQEQPFPQPFQFTIQSHSITKCTGINQADETEQLNSTRINMPMGVSQIHRLFLHDAGNVASISTAVAYSIILPLIQRLLSAAHRLISSF